jgi:hypothetical protein
MFIFDTQFLNLLILIRYIKYSYKRVKPKILTTTTTKNGH